MEVKENTRKNENIQKVIKNKNVIYTEEKVIIPTGKLNMRKKLKNKHTYLKKRKKQRIRLKN